MKSIILLTVLFTLVGCQQNKKTYFTPTTQDITTSVYSSITIQPDSLYAVYSVAIGILEKTFIEESDEVEVGQKIFQLSNNNPKLSLENARLSMQIAKENYNGMNAILEDLKNEVILAELKYKNDSITFQRQQNLWNQKIGSQSEYDARKLSFETSFQTLKILINKYLRTENELKQQVQQAKNNYESTLFISNDFTIQSKISGRIYAIFKNTGELVSTQQPIAMIGSKSKFIVELLVDEVDIAKITLGQLVLVTLDAYKNEVFEAQVTKIYPQKNERSQTFKIEADFIKAPSKLYPGLSGEGNIIVSIKKNALVVPKIYLTRDKTIKTEDGFVKVETGLESLDMIEITSGIDENTTVFLPEEQ